MKNNGKGYGLNRKILIIILILAVVAVLVSATMKNSNLFFNGGKHDSVNAVEYILVEKREPFSVYAQERVFSDQNPSSQRAYAPE